MDEDIEGQGSRRGLIAAVIGSVLAAGATAIAAAAARRRKLAGTTVELSVDIDRPADEVFAFVSDARNDVQWLNEAIERRKLTVGPVGVGTRIESIDRFGPRTVTTIEEISEFEPGRRVLTTISGAWNGSYEMRVEPDGDGSVLSLRAELHGSGLLGLLDVLPDRLTQRTFERQSVGLKDLLERRAETVVGVDDENGLDDRKELASVKVETGAEVPG